MNKLFVGNLPFVMEADELKEVFERFGNVVSVKIPTDRDTGRKRGFAFVEMDNAQSANKAIFGLNDRLVAGRNLSVSLAKPKAA